jgi:AcrR family transcriptional regulator
MPGEAKMQVKYQTPLREAQRDLTRSRILDAARSLFFTQHFDTATMDEIALAAGLRRSTLYLHFRDKDEILLEVISAYGDKAKKVLATLPGPAPSLAQIRRWVSKVARFVAKERAPLSIVVEVRRRQGFASTLEVLTNDLLESLGSNNPCFRGTGSADAEPVRRARALMLLQELTYACEIHLEDSSAADGRALLQITAEDFHSFLN